MTEGAADIRFARRDGITHLAQLYQRDPLRVLFPTPAAGDPPVAVIVTTSGGLVAGDRDIPERDEVIALHAELAHLIALMKGKQVAAARALPLSEM